MTAHPSALRLAEARRCAWDIFTSLVILSLIVMHVSATTRVSAAERLLREIQTAPLPEDVRMSIERYFNER